MDIDRYGQIDEYRWIWMDRQIWKLIGMDRYEWTDMYN